jgi:cell division transport system permease protein
MFQARYDLPLERDVTGRFLPWIIALMVWLAMLALAGAMAVSGMADRWDKGLAGTLTVQVPPRAGGSEAGTPDRRVEVALELLRATPGVAAAEPLGGDELSDLLSPWLGGDAALDDLPVPALIDVRLSGDPSVDASALADRLAEAVPGTQVDDHQAWLDDLLALARTLEALAAAVVALVGAAAMAAVIFVTRAGLAIHARVVELLHLIGASDQYVARQFQRHVLGLALRGSIGGALLAALTLLGLRLAGGDLLGGLLPEVPLSPLQMSALAVVPAAAALTAAATARATVMRSLERLP